MVYTVTATHRFFDQPLVLERDVPFKRASARAWVSMYMMQAFPSVDWFAEMANVRIGMGDEMLVPYYDFI